MVSRVRVRHSTTFTYADVVHASFNEARISPLDTQSQFTIEHRVEVHPAANLFRYRDYWGSRVHAFDLHGPHRELTVVGTSVVETSDRSPSIDLTVNWDTLSAPGLTDRLFEYLAETPMTAANDAVLEVADNLRRAPTPGDALAGLGPWIRDHVVYEPGATNVSTTAVEVLTARRGVCQDFAHLALAVLRAAGIPARYASGYLYPETEGIVAETYAGQSHTWIEAWVGDWHPLDPTSGSPVGERHVIVARGRDYSDVVPLKGVYNGGPSVSLDVSVELTRVL